MSYAVYEHVSPSGKVYVGITSTPVHKRWQNGHGYSKNHPKFYNAILKYGWDNFKHLIVLSDVSKEEAIYTEKYLIKWYKLHKLSYNITDGGEGHSVPKGTLIVSEETRKKLSNSLKGKMAGEKHWNYGNKGSKAICFGKYGKNHPASKTVYQYNIFGEFLKRFDSITDAVDELQLPKNSRMNISNSCNLDYYRCNFGYIWSFEYHQKLDLSDYKICYSGTKISLRRRNR